MKPKTETLILAIAFLTAVQPTRAAIVGTNEIPRALTVERVASLPAAEQSAWRQYLEHSAQQRKADQQALADEARKRGANEPAAPPEGRNADSIPLRNAPAWYGTAEARRIADVILSYQTPAGGWSKNLDMTGQPRAAGQQYGDAGYIGTFDNDATVTQLRYLARVATAAASGTNGYRAGFLKGIDYILAAQYPNGGWPQVWPLAGGYHDSITFNDNAVVNVLQLLRDAAGGAGDYAFIPAEVRRQAAASVERGVKCILACQITANGHRTVWCQQHDPLTLLPTPARNYEMPSQTGAESARLMAFLMDLPDPNAEVVAAVHAAADWYQKARITSGSHAGSWARFYQIGTDLPLFGDRDRSIHDTVTEISAERQKGYSWFNNAGQAALTRYEKWSQTHPRNPPPK